MRTILFVLTLTLSGADLVTGVRESIARGNLAGATEMIRAYRASKGVTPEAVEAISWMARGELAQKNLVQADKYAQETYKLTLEQLKAHPLARTINLQVALGSAIEVEANVLVTRGQRSEAIIYLQEQLKTYYATPLRARIQKNINVLSLEGKRAPALEHAQIPAASRHCCSSGRIGAATVSTRREFWLASKRNSRRKVWCSSHQRKSTATLERVTMRRPKWSFATSRQFASISTVQ